MLWLMLFIISLTFTTWAQRLESPYEGLALALYMVGLFSGLWGIFMAPTLVQLMLGLITWLSVQGKFLPSIFKFPS